LIVFFFVFFKRLESSSRSSSVRVLSPVASIASLVEFPVLVVVESVLELDRLLLRLRLLSLQAKRLRLLSLRLCLLVLACFICLVV
jgi:hypothetical protein